MASFSKIIFHYQAIYICFVILLVFFSNHYIFAQDNNPLNSSQKRKCVSIVSEKNAVTEGSEIKFILKFEGDMEAYLQRYVWSASDGYIIEGQGLHWIVLSTVGQGGKEIKVKVEISDLPNDCEKTASTVIKVNKTIGDIFRNADFDYQNVTDFKSFLNELIISLHNDVNAKAVIVFHIEETSKINLKHLLNVTKTEMKKHGILSTRFKLVDVKYKRETYDRDSFIQFWLIPKDVDFPLLNQ